jgi:hypothetical protein
MKNLLTISLTAIITAGFMFTIQGEARPSDLWKIIDDGRINIYAFEDRDNVCYITQIVGNGNSISCTKK